ncbi:MAG: putative lipid II flippase FtsW [Candidatus Kerfeldbacteria bacterium CG08_land_8_20_14_0_20_43_14]|uniref:Probable peptidoglycan glycosyltransferase FtsW n=1 Tax=Candidatus Kerfeldbacteria bacterium CG08_land_8_20_14_0_20_43_14 TaxID=2014246 RepID=A0A2H0YRP1_9BACT|nr:MAG: putative lipid II flippase FtsW [Candidatus Kerfeldbacteria bacterium CG08_land_8_20_14_0_20_43_14]
MIAYRRPDSIFLALIISLCTLGVIIFSSASSAESFQTLGDPNGLLIKQIIPLLMGFIFSYFLQSLDYQKLLKWSKIILIISFVLLFLPFIPGIGKELLGASRWINIGGFFFQPSEALKTAMIIFLAAWLPGIRNNWQNLSKSFYPFVAILGLASVILMLQSDLGTTIILFIIAVVMYFAAGAPVKHLLWMFLGIIIVVLLMVKIEPYRASRLTTFLNPNQDVQGTGYHINRSLLAIGSGGLFGRGLGKSVQKFNNLPEAAGDSIFAVAAEELGFFAVLGIVALYAALFIRGRRLIAKCSDEGGRLIMIGTITWITAQAFVNIGALTALLPLTGVPLPFISNGGTALIFLLASTGIFLNVTKQLRS